MPSLMAAQCSGCCSMSRDMQQAAWLKRVAHSRRQPRPSAATLASLAPACLKLVLSLSSDISRFASYVASPCFILYPALAAPCVTRQHV